MDIIRVTNLWRPPPYLDDEILPGAKNFYREQEEPAWPPPRAALVQSIPWNATTFLDDEILPGAKNFFLDYHEPWVAQVQMQPWLALPFLDDDLWMPPVFEDEWPAQGSGLPGSPLVETVPWYALAFLDDEILPGALSAGLVAATNQDQWPVRFPGRHRSVWIGGIDQGTDLALFLLPPSGLTFQEPIPSLARVPHRLAMPAAESPFEPSTFPIVPELVAPSVAQDPPPVRSARDIWRPLAVTASRIVLLGEDVPAQVGSLWTWPASVQLRRPLDKFGWDWQTYPLPTVDTQIVGWDGGQVVPKRVGRQASPGQSGEPGEWRLTTVWDVSPQVPLFPAPLLRPDEPHPEAWQQSEVIVSLFQVQAVSQAPGRPSRTRPAESDRILTGHLFDPDLLPLVEVQRALVRPTTRQAVQLEPPLAFLADAAPWAELVQDLWKPRQRRGQLDPIQTLALDPGIPFEPLLLGINQVQPAGPRFPPPGRDRGQAAGLSVEIGPQPDLLVGLLAETARGWPSGFRRPGPDPVQPLTVTLDVQPWQALLQENPRVLSRAVGGRFVEQPVWAPVVPVPDQLVVSSWGVLPVQVPRRDMLLKSADFLLPWAFLADVAPWADLAQDRRQLPRPGRQVRDACPPSWTALDPSVPLEPLLLGLAFTTLARPLFSSSARDRSQVGTLSVEIGPQPDLLRGLLAEQAQAPRLSWRRPGPDPVQPLTVVLDLLPWEGVLQEFGRPVQPARRQPGESLAWTAAIPIPDQLLIAAWGIEPALLPRRIAPHGPARTGAPGDSSLSLAVVADVAPWVELNQDQRQLLRTASRRTLDEAWPVTDPSLIFELLLLGLPWQGVTGPRFPAMPRDRSQFSTITIEVGPQPDLLVGLLAAGVGVLPPGRRRAGVDPVQPFTMTLDLLPWPALLLQGPHPGQPSRRQPGEAVTWTASIPTPDGLVVSAWGVEPAQILRRVPQPRQALEVLAMPALTAPELWSAALIVTPLPVLPRPGAREGRQDLPSLATIIDLPSWAGFLGQQVVPVRGVRLPLLPTSVEPWTADLDVMPWTVVLVQNPRQQPARPRAFSEASVLSLVQPVPDDVLIFGTWRADTHRMQSAGVRRGVGGETTMTPVAQLAEVFAWQFPQPVTLMRPGIGRPGEGKEDAALWQQAAVLAGDLLFSQIHVTAQLPGWRPRQRSTESGELPRAQEFMPLPESLVQVATVQPQPNRWTAGEAQEAVSVPVWWIYSSVILTGQYVVTAQDVYQAGAVTGDAVMN